MVRPVHTSFMDSNLVRSEDSTKKPPGNSVEGVEVRTTTRIDLAQIEYSIVMMRGNLLDSFDWRLPTAKC